MTDENTNDQTEPETTDAPEGRADADNLPLEQVPEGDAQESADEAPLASAEPEAESTEEPAEGSPADDNDEPTAGAVEQPAAEAESTEEPAEGSAEAVEEPTASEAETGDAATGESGAPVGAGEPADAPEAPVKRKKKRLPRALRPPRTKPRRERPAERKPISRLPKPEHARGRRQERQGTVVSANADKTIVVRVDVVKVHPMYKKVVKRSTKLHAHDEANRAKVGDVVRLVETRPLSKLKRWRLQEIVEEAK